MKKIISIVTTMILCIGCIATFTSCGTPSPTEVTTSFLEAVKAEDSDALKEVYAGDSLDFSSTTLLDDDTEKTDAVKKFKKMLLDFDYEVTDEKIDGDKATVNVKLSTYEFGKAMTNMYTEMLENILEFSSLSDEESEKKSDEMLIEQVNYSDL